MSLDLESSSEIILIPNLTENQLNDIIPQIKHFYTYQGLESHNIDQNDLRYIIRKLGYQKYYPNLEQILEVIKHNP